MSCVPSDDFRHEFGNLLRSSGPGQVGGREIQAQGQEGHLIAYQAPPADDPKPRVCIRTSNFCRLQTHRHYQLCSHPATGGVLPLSTAPQPAIQQSYPCGRSSAPPPPPRASGSSTLSPRTPATPACLPHPRQQSTTATPSHSRLTPCQQH